MDKANECANELQQDTNQMDISSQLKLGVRYYKGDGVPKDHLKAAELFRQAAEKGNSDGQIRLGLCYAEGTGVTQDLQQAFNLFSQAAEQDNPWALGRIGWCYRYGKGVKADITKASEFYQKAIKKGNLWAAVRLGEIYYDGVGVKRNYKKAVELFELAAQEESEGLTWLGSCYENGKGIAKNPIKATEFYQKAADQGDSWAMARLAHRYEYGLGIAADLNKAADLYRRASVRQGVMNKVILYRLVSAGLIKANEQDNFEELFKTLDSSKLGAYDLQQLAIAADMANNHKIALQYYEKCLSAPDFSTLGASTRDDIKLIVYFRQREFTDYFKILASCYQLFIQSECTIKLFIPSGKLGYSPRERHIILACVQQWTAALNNYFDVVEVWDKRNANICFVPVHEQAFAGSCWARTICKMDVWKKGKILPKIKKCSIQLPLRQIISDDDVANMTHLCLHEIGHALGLMGHSLFANDIMSNGSTHRTVLSESDIQAINSLYMDTAESQILSILMHETEKENLYAFSRLGVYYLKDGQYKKGFDLLNRGRNYRAETIEDLKLFKFLSNVTRPIERIVQRMKRNSATEGE
jgi:TPR repeat protein